MPKIGNFVEQHVLAIAQYCEENPLEFDLLQSDEYTKTTLGLNYAFFRKPRLVEGKYVGKYRKNPQVVVGGEAIQFTNDLYAKHYPAFIEYLEAKRIIDRRLAAAYLRSLPEIAATTKSARPNPQGTLKALPIGNAQNLFVRNVLGRIRPDEQSYGGWETTWDYFGGQCAYCGIPLRVFDRDHVYGINYLGVGEHKRGNLVPACKDCNKDKSDTDFRTFLKAKHTAHPEEATNRITMIELFMTERDYSPFALDPRIDEQAISDLLQEGRLKVEALAAEYATRIRGLLDN